MIWRNWLNRLLAGGEGFEPSTPNLGGWCSLRDESKTTREPPFCRELTNPYWATRPTEQAIRADCIYTNTSITVKGKPGNHAIKNRAFWLQDQSFLTKNVKGGFGPLKKDSYFRRSRKSFETTSGLAFPRTSFMTIPISKPYAFFPSLSTCCLFAPTTRSMISIRSDSA